MRVTVEPHISGGPYDSGWRAGFEAAARFFDVKVVACKHCHCPVRFRHDAWVHISGSVYCDDTGATKGEPA